AISNALANGDKVSLIGFGTFSVAERGARQGVNPATKQAIEIPAKKVAKFKAGAELAEKVN
ncbi:MAG: HU family DNA-binding protein, partial [Paludibacteraceae bacterium]|nr:HU family DNA-binding protein [Paludibacteraceae bacterium]